MAANVRGIDHLWHNLLEVPCSNQPHVHGKFIGEDVQRVVNTFVSVRRESVEERPANPDWSSFSAPYQRNRRTHTCSSTQCNSLDHVRGPPHTTVDEQLELLVRETQPPSRLQLSCHLHKDLDTRPSEVKLATTVVRKHNTAQPSIIGFQSILGAAG